MALISLASSHIGCGEPRKIGDSGIPSEEQQLLQEFSNASRQMSKEVGQTVVRIVARRAEGSPASADEFAELFGSSSDPTLIGQGSGVIVSPDGAIVTNYHVIKNAAQIDVYLGEEAPCPGTVVGFDALTDLAVIKISLPDRTLSVASWGNSDELEVGEFVWAVGNPYGLSGSISFGILSAKNRQGLTENFLNDFLQTDAAVNPGNSGGPLVDSSGKIVGINTAIIGQSYGGISFAIPSSTARPIFERLNATGSVSRGWIGVTLDVVTRQRARDLGLPNTRGAYIAAISDKPNSPSQKAGLLPGDVVTNWKNIPVTTPVMLARAIAQTPVSETVTVRLIRKGVPLSLEVMVDERP